MYYAQQYALPHLISLLVSLLLGWLSWRRPTVGRLAFFALCA